MEINIIYLQFIYLTFGLAYTIIGPYFSGDSNWDVLIPDLRQSFLDRVNPANIDRNISYEQNGATQHSAAAVRNYLNEVFYHR